MKHIVTAYNIVSESQENINALAEMTGIENPVLHLIEIHNTGDPIGWLVEKDEQGYITGPSI